MPFIDCVWETEHAVANVPVLILTEAKIRTNDKARKTVTNHLGEII